MSEKKDRVIAVLDKESREKLDFICKRDKRAMSNMMLFLIDYYYKQVREKENRGGIVYNKMTKEEKEDFKKLRGIGLSGRIDDSYKSVESGE